MDVGLAGRRRHDVMRLAQSGLEWTRLASATSDAVADVIPYDHACWHTFDPATLLFTGGVARDLDYEPRLAEVEYEHADVNKWSFLAHQDRPVGVLSEATRGDLTVSPRWEIVLRPRGIADELRLALVSGGWCWGSFTLYRDHGRPSFNETDKAYVAALSGHLADGVRRSMVLDARARHHQIPEPGLVIIHGEEVQSANDAAREWMSEMVEISSGSPAAIPSAVWAVASATRAIALGYPGPVQRPRAQVRTAVGAWLTLLGLQVDAADPSVVGVLIEPVQAPDLPSIIARAYALTEREQAVLLLCCHGLSTKAIAVAMCLGVYTVQGHLSAMFEKVGVQSRGALVARIYYDQHV